MRSLGVVRWNGIELGPAPLAEGDEPKTRKDPVDREAERRRVSLSATARLVRPL